MGLTTFAQMQADVRSMLGGRTDKDSIIMRGLQFAQVRISRIFHFEELFTSDSVTLQNTGSGNELTDSTIAMPSTMRKLHSLVLTTETSPVPLKGLSSERWEKIVRDPTYYGRGKPDLYVLRYHTVIVYRPPDGTYTLNRLYTKWPTPIVLNVAGDAPLNDTDVSDLEQKDDLLTLSAAIWTALHLGIDYREQANYWFSILRNDLKDAGAFEFSKPDTVISATPRSYVEMDHSVPSFGDK